MPTVTLTAPWNNQGLQIDPSLSNQVGLFIVIEYGNLKFEVVGGLMHCEAKFMIPEMMSAHVPLQQETTASQVFTIGEFDHRANPCRFSLLPFPTEPRSRDFACP